jgi:hypothetical protein
MREIGGVRREAVDRWSNASNERWTAGVKSGGPLDCNVSGGPLDYKISGGPLDYKISGGPLDYKISGGPLKTTTRDTIERNFSYPQAGLI